MSRDELTRTANPANPASNDIVKKAIRIAAPTTQPTIPSRIHRRKRTAALVPLTRRAKRGSCRDSTPSRSERIFCSCSDSGISPPPTLFSASYRRRPLASIDGCSRRDELPPRDPRNEGKTQPRVATASPDQRRFSRASDQAAFGGVPRFAANATTSRSGWARELAASATTVAPLASSARRRVSRVPRGLSP